MTREEEIRNKAVNEQKTLMESMDWRAGFISGSKWADSNPQFSKEELIEKAYEWLKNRHNIEKHIGILTSKSVDLSEAFKKAMEE